MALPSVSRGKASKVSEQSLSTFVKAHRNKRGLTQTQLAGAANISTSYVTKIETGHYPNPSESVLAQLSAALDLDSGDEQTLYMLAGRAPRASWHQTSAGAALARDLYTHLLDDDLSPKTRKMVIDAHLNVIDANTQFRSSFRGVEDHSTWAEWQFLDVRARVVHEQWERDAKSTVWWLRTQLSKTPEHDGLRALIGRLNESADFRRLWAHPTSDTPPADTMRICDYQTREVLTLVSAYFQRRPVGDIAVYFWIGVPIGS